MPGSTITTIPMRGALLASCAALAFTVNPSLSSARQTDPGVEPRWAAQIELGFNGSTGNTRLALLSTSAQVRHLVTDEFRFEVGGIFRYGESEGNVIARNMRGSLNVDLVPLAAISPFVFATAERDPFRRLRARLDAGGGSKFTFLRRGDDELSLSTAALYNHEAFFPAADGRLTPTRNEARWSARGRARIRLLESLRAEHTTFYQPVWNRPGDYNVDAVTRLTARISQRFAIGFSHNYRYDSTPPPDVLRADQTVQANVTIQF